MLEGSRAQFGYIPSGIDGVKATLRIMVSMVRQSLSPKSPTKTTELQVLRETAVRAVQHCPEKDNYCEANALQLFVRDKIRYVFDMRESETLQFPFDTLRLLAGDCDDKSMLLCALAECIGIASRFCAIGVKGEDFSHVSAQLMIPGSGWVNAETIPIDSKGTKVALGWFPPDCTVFMTAHI